MQKPPEVSGLLLLGFWVGDMGKRMIGQRNRVFPLRVMFRVQSETVKYPKPQTLNPKL